MSDLVQPENAPVSTDGVDAGTLYDVLMSVQGDENPGEGSDEGVEPQSEEGMESTAVEPAEGTTEEDPFESYLNELSADPVDDEAEEDAEALKEVASNPKSRVPARIRKLANQRKEAQEKAAQLEQQMQQMQQTVERQAQILRQQLAQQMQFQQQAQMTQQQRQPLPNEPANAFDELLGHLTPRLQKELETRLSPLQQRLEAYEQREKQLQQQQAYQQQVQAIEQEAASVRNRVIPGLDEQTYQDPAFSAALDNYLITQAVANNKPVSEIVTTARKDLAVLAKAMTDAARRKGQNIKGKPVAPPTLSDTAGSVTKSDGVPLYSSSQIRQAGYVNTLDAAQDRWARLRGVEPQDGWS